MGAFVVVTYLELIGTSLRIWTWAPHDPTGIVAMGNPPSGAAGGYGWFDLAAVAPVAPAARRRPGQDRRVRPRCRRAEIGPERLARRASLPSTASCSSRSS